MGSAGSLGACTCSGRCWVWSWWWWSGFTRCCSGGSGLGRCGFSNEAGRALAETGWRPGMSAMGRDALEECDLVMKGGVTSGIVYPPAILALKNKYRFRQIGGASAGAIAAALCAAAECGRERGGFEKLEQVNAKLAGGTFLRDLFQPGPGTRPLFEALMRALQIVTAEYDRPRTSAGGDPRKKPAL